MLPSLFPSSLSPLFSLFVPALQDAGADPAAAAGQAAGQAAGNGALPQGLGEVGDKAAQWGDTAVELAMTHGPGLVAGLIIFIVGRMLVKLVTNLLRKLMRRRQMDEMVSGFLCSLIYGLGLTMVVVSAFETMGMETTSFVAVLGAAGLAVGLALQGSLANFASGVLLLVFRPFKQGDYVEVAGTAGVVASQAIFMTTLTTPDNKKIMIPNSEITGGVIVNFSALETRRIDMLVGIGYDDDMGQARDVIRGVLEAESRVLKDPAPVVAVHELGDSSVNLVVRPWVKTSDFWAVRWALTEAIKNRLDEAGITIPYPQRDVHLHGAGAGVGAT